MYCEFAISLWLRFDVSAFFFQLFFLPPMFLSVTFYVWIKKTIIFFESIFKADSKKTNFHCNFAAAFFILCGFQQCINLKYIINVKSLRSGLWFFCFYYCNFIESCSKCIEESFQTKLIFSWSILLVSHWLFNSFVFRINVENLFLAKK